MGDQAIGGFFDLSFSNWPSILLALVPGLVNLYIVFYILLRFPPQNTTRVFALFTLALTCWQFNDVFARMSTSEFTAKLWDNLFSVGWIAVAPLGLYFSLLYTGRRRVANNLLILAAIFIPALVFEAIYNAEVFPHEFEKTDFWGYVNSHNGSTLDALMVYWISYLVLIMLAVLVEYAYRVRANPVRRQQAFLIALGLGIPTLQGLVTQMVMPLILDTTSVPVTSSFMSVFSVAAAIALTRYRLFSVSETLHSETLLDNMSDIVFTLSPERQITYINRYGADMLGMPEGRIEGYTLHELFPTDHRVLNIFVQKVLLPTMRGRHVENCHGMLKRRDGQPIDVLFAADPLDEGEKVQGILVVAHNITEMKQAEERIREKNVELERSNAELETFAFVASHDMKEPLRMVSNYTQLLANRYKDRLDSDGKDFINYAVEGVHRMQQLISDLLNYARIGKADLANERLDLNELLKEVHANLEAEIKNANAVLHISHLPAVRGVRTQYIQIFQNLIGNALKFRGEWPPEIWVDAEDKGDEWLFTVRDNGIGIDEAYKDKVFVLFQRLHNREKYAGTGIGLSVCKKIIELHGGRIWFESRLGQGTTFFFTLPK